MGMHIARVLRRPHPSRRLRRRPWLIAACAALTAASLATACSSASSETGTDAGTATSTPPTVPTSIPDGLTLRVGDQLGYLQQSLKVSGQDQDLPYTIEYSAFVGGPPMLQAFQGDAI